MPFPPTPPASADAAWVVLDTNVWLDLLVFGDAGARPLAAALKAGRLRAVATSAMFDELADVLSRRFLAKWQADPASVLTQARALCRQVHVVDPTDGVAPRCADRDDQPFVDLAWCWPARWLFSRDRSVLDLARQARGRGLGILTPTAWAAASQSSALAPGERP